MNSSFTVSDLGGYSPLDYGLPSVAGTAPAVSATPASPSTGRREASRRSGSAAAPTAEEFKVHSRPTLLGRRVDPNTRRIYPTVERLAVEPHSFTLTLEAVTPALLAREERRKEKRAKWEEKEEGGKRQSCGASLQQTTRPVQNQRAASAGVGKVEKSRLPAGLLRQKKGGDGDGPKASNMALVRLSSGKIVKVPAEILMQHQAALKARSGGKVPHANGSVAAPPTSSLLAQGRPVVAGGASGQARLSQVLAKISPAATSAAATATTSAPSLAGPTRSILTTKAQQPVATPGSPAGTAALPQSVMALLNGRLPPVPKPLTNVPKDQRLVKIRANAGPPAAKVNGVLSSPPPGLPAARLSDRLSTLVPTTVVTVSATSVGSNGIPLVVGNPSGSTMLVNGSPVRLRTYQGPNSPAQQQQLPQQQVVHLNGQRLSAALSSVAGSPTGSPASSPAKQAVERVYVLGPGGQVSSKATASGHQVLQASLPAAAGSRVQLAPIFARRTVSAAVAAGGASGSPGQLQQQQVHQLQLNPEQLKSLTAQLPAGSSARAIVVHHGPQQPPGSPQLVRIASSPAGGSPQRIIAATSPVTPSSGSPMQRLVLTSPQQPARLPTAAVLVSPQRLTGHASPRMGSPGVPRMVVASASPVRRPGPSGDAPRPMQTAAKVTTAATATTTEASGTAKVPARPAKRSASPPESSSAAKKAKTENS